MNDEIRVGDRFLVEAEVWLVPEKGDEVACMLKRSSGANENRYITASVLLAGRRLPRVIKAGDRVTVRGVIAVDDDRAWITNRHRDGEWDGFIPLSDLTPIPGDEK